jgi:hypothetical protein
MAVRTPIMYAQMMPPTSMKMMVTMCSTKVTGWMSP